MFYTLVVMWNILECVCGVFLIICSAVVFCFESAELQVTESLEFTDPADHVTKSFI